jgi:phosphatidate cytidylyltransferase
MSRPNKHRFIQRICVLGLVAPIVVKAARSRGIAFELISALVAACAGSETGRLLKLADVKVSAACATGTSVAVAYAGPVGYASAIPFALADRGSGPGRRSELYSAMAVGSYIGLPIHAGLKLKRSKNGSDWLIYGLLSTWANDAADYLLGPYFGGPPLPTWLSDRKTWAGYIPGIVLSTTIGGLSASRLKISRQGGIQLGILLGASAAVGDMFESGLKRRAQQADSGAILPGYGGMLDRLDSLLTAMAILYWAHRRWSR